MNNDEISSLQARIDALAHGVDPSSNMSFKSDTILNSHVNKKTLEDVSLLLKTILQKNIKRDKRLKNPFHIAGEELKLIPLSEEPVAISKFSHTINMSINRATMKKLRAMQITEWLVMQGYLKEEAQNGKRVKVLTETSHTIGMSSIPKTNIHGIVYDVTLYDINAQSFILSKISEGALL